MEPYARSVQSVDAALNRLKATLASYRLEVQPSSGSKDPTKDISKGIARGHHLDAATTPPSTTSSSLKKTETETPVSHGGSASAQPQQAAANARDAVWREVLALRSEHQIRQIIRDELQPMLADVALIFGLIRDRPYCLPLYIVLAQKHLQLGYPDLAAGAAYKALLLSDSVQDLADEYHDDACDAIREVILQQSVHERISLLKGELHGVGSAGPGVEFDVEVDLWLRKHYECRIYELLSRSLLLCECYRSAHEYATKGLTLFPNHNTLSDCVTAILKKVAKHFNSTATEVATTIPVSSWPDKGHVRREQYAWSNYEPSRASDLETLNAMMSAVAPKLEIRAVELPALTPGKEEVVTQLGVFAKEDIAPGEAILDETSMLTANNKLQDALCDACSADLPSLNSEAAASIVPCQDCDVVFFCSPKCHDYAQNSYHPALCDRDVEAIAKDVPPAEAADSLYALLLLRAFAMAETQNVHPLELKEVKYIWGDFSSQSYMDAHWTPPSPTTSDPDAHNIPRTLPFSFEKNIRLPFHMLEKMDLDIFATPHFDGWVFNTLYAKFRGTASARLSGLGGRAIRGPEVSAVHTMWCMANHSCDPNVGWEWGGSIKFWAREQRVTWATEVFGEGEGAVRSQTGIRKGEEVLSHYCDVDLPVSERREWARGSLGGDCMCTRCLYEARAEALMRGPAIPRKHYHT